MSNSQKLAKAFFVQYFNKIHNGKGSSSLPGWANECKADLKHNFYNTCIFLKSDLKPISKRERI